MTLKHIVDEKLKKEVDDVARQGMKMIEELQKFTNMVGVFEEKFDKEYIIKMKKEVETETDKESESDKLKYMEDVD